MIGGSILPSLSKSAAGLVMLHGSATWKGPFNEVHPRSVGSRAEGEIRMGKMDLKLGTLYSVLKRCDQTQYFQLLDQSLTYR